MKLIAIVIVADVVIIGSSLGFAYLAAGSHVLQALLGAALLAILESMRIPVALKLGAGKIASKARVGLAVLILAGGMLATTINAVPIINGLWSSRLEAVRQDEAQLAKAQSAKDSGDAKKLAAGGAADRAAKALKIVKGHTKAIRGNFIAANNASYANTRQDDRTVADAEAALATDRQASNLHLLYASITGEEVSSITDRQLAPLLRVAVFAPALLLGLLTTAGSLLAAPPVKPPAAAKEKTFEGPDTLLVDLEAHLPNGLADRAAAIVEERQKAKPENPAAPSPAASEPATDAAPAKPKKAPAANGGAARPAARPRGRPRNAPAVPNGGKKTGNSDARGSPPPSSSQT